MYGQKIRNYGIPQKNKISKNTANWNLNPNMSVLLIHDMQNYFLKHYDDNQLIKEVINNIASLKLLCKKSRIPIIYTIQPKNQDAEIRGLLSDFWGAGITNSIDYEIVNQLKPEEDDIIIIKDKYTAFYGTDLLTILKKLNRDSLIITGVYGHTSCAATACNAFENNLKAFAIADCIADINKHYHVETLNYIIHSCGVVKYLDDLNM